MKNLSTLAITLTLLSNPGAAGPNYSSKSQHLMDELIELLSATKEISYTEFFVQTYAEKYSQLYSQYTTIDEKELKILINDEAHRYINAKINDNSLNARLYSLYKENFTDKDLQAMIKFYSTEIGIKSLLVLPEVLKNQDITARLWGQELEVPLREQLTKRMMKENVLKPATVDK